MKEIQIDDLDEGDEVALCVPGHPFAIHGTYTGLIYDTVTKRCEIEIVTPFGFEVHCETRWKPVIFRTKRAPKKKQEAA